MQIPHPDFCWLSPVLSPVEVFFQLLKTLSKRLIQKSQVMLTNILAFRSQQASYDIINHFGGKSASDSIVGVSICANLLV